MHDVHVNQQMIRFNFLTTHNAELLLDAALVSRIGLFSFHSLYNNAMNTERISSCICGSQFNQGTDVRTVFLLSDQCVLMG